MKNADQPIKPLQHQGFPTFEHNLSEGELIGLTKREYFAGLAMQGILSSRGLQSALNQDRTPWEEEAVRQADFLLAELEKPTKL